MLRTREPRDHIPFQVAVHDCEKDLEEEVDGIDQYREEVQPCFSGHHCDCGWLSALEIATLVSAVQLVDCFSSYLLWGRLPSVLMRARSIWLSTRCKGKNGN